MTGARSDHVRTARTMSDHAGSAGPWPPADVRARRRGTGRCRDNVFRSAASYHSRRRRSACRVPDTRVAPSVGHIGDTSPWHHCKSSNSVVAAPRRDDSILLHRGRLRQVTVVRIPGRTVSTAWASNNLVRFERTVEFLCTVRPNDCNQTSYWRALARISLDRAECVRNDSPVCGGRDAQ